MTANTTAELAKMAAAIPPLIEALERRILNVTASMTKLEKAGLIYATEHWRKDDSEQPKYLYLLYRQKAGKARKRVYVGCNPERIECARAGIQRAREYDGLARQYETLVGRVQAVTEALKDARYALTC